jgi:ATP-dependent Clp protease ATP-binding subunit ClpA
LGLTSDRASIGGHALSSLGVRYDDVRGCVAAIVEPDGGDTNQRVAMSPRAKQLLEASVRSALQRSRTRIGTSDLTLALVGIDDSTAGRVLDDLGIERGALRDRVLEIAATTATSKPRPLPSVTSVHVELSPEMQALLRRLLRTGSMYLARRYVPPKFLHGALTTTRFVRTMNVRAERLMPPHRDDVVVHRDDDAGRASHQQHEPDREIPMPGAERRVTRERGKARGHEPGFVARDLEADEPD